MDSPPSAGLRLGRYVLFEPIATGGMASVHFGRFVGEVGFARTIAIKRLHPHLAGDPEFVQRFVMEAMLAARVHHPNVVSTLDVVANDGEVFLVLDYVRGETLASLLRAAPERVPLGIASSILSGALHGLHAAHEATTDRGAPLGIVHRDVSPQNILVGEDGVVRLADFGIAKATWDVQSTREGALRGKLAYMAPEQADGQRVDRRTDVYAAGAVLWEAIVGRKLVVADEPAHALALVLTADHAPPSAHVDGVPPALDAVVMRALASDREARFVTALDMAAALEAAIPPAPQSAVAAWVRARAGETLSARAARLAAIEATSIRPAEGPAAKVATDYARVAHAADAPTADFVPPSARHESTKGLEVAVRPPRRRGAAGLVAAAALVAVAIAGWQWRARTSPASAPAAAAAPPASAPAAAAAPPASAAPAEAPPASAAVVASAAPSASARATPRKRTNKECDPPYVLDPSSKDPDGRPMKRFKAWCL